jgi:hypothetical protein
VIISAVSATWPEGASRQCAILTLGLLQIIVVILTLREVLRVQRNQWQQKFTEFRFVAEVLRTDSFARLLAVPCNYSQKSSFYESAQEQSEVQVVLRSILRTKGFGKVNLSDNSYVSLASRDISEFLLQSQKGYHDVNAARSLSMEQKLEKTALLMFLFALAITTANVIGIYFRFSEVVFGCLTFFGTIAPVIAISAQSISQNAELKRLAKRSSYLKAHLTKDIAAFEAANTIDEKRKTLSKVMDLMLTESNDWKAQYKIQNVSL